jgi:hypothetical protein
MAMSTYPLRTNLDANSGTYWRKLLIEYDVDGDIIYLGQHVDSNIADTDTSHMVKKFTMDINKNITKIQTLSGSWTSRDTLGWT